MLFFLKKAIFKGFETQLPIFYLEFVLVPNERVKLDINGYTICAYKQLQLQLIAHKIRSNLRKKKV